MSTLKSFGTYDLKGQGPVQRFEADYFSFTESAEWVHFYKRLGEADDPQVDQLLATVHLDPGWSVEVRNAESNVVILPI